MISVFRQAGEQREKDWADPRPGVPNFVANLIANLIANAPDGRNLLFELNRELDRELNRERRPKGANPAALACPAVIGSGQQSECSESLLIRAAYGLVREEVRD